MFEIVATATHKQKLKSFVTDTVSFISTALDNGRWSLTDPPIAEGPFLENGTLPLAQAALKEFNEQGESERLLTAIDQADDAKLQSHGLTGHQLLFKLNNVLLRANAFRANPVFSVLKRLIRAIDTLLKSILDGTLAGRALAELKDAAQDATEDDGA